MSFQSVLMMSFQSVLIMCVCLLSGAIAGRADSTVYVTMTNAPGSVTPFNIETGKLGAASFVPPAGIQISQPPGKQELWELTIPSEDFSLYAISILDPKSLARIARISLNFYPTSLAFDPAGKNAYVSGLDVQTYDGELLQIDVASRAIVQTVTLATSEYSDGFQLAFSSDGATLFLPTASYEVMAIATASLAVVGVIPTPGGVGSLLVSGTTLLIPSGSELLYIDTSTLEQTKSATVTPNSSIFGMSPDQRRIYLYCYYSNDVPPITVIDFTSGSTLLSQTFPQVDLVDVVLSPDGTKIVIGSSPVVLVDSATLGTIQTVTSVGIANSAVFLTSDDLLLLNAPTDAMASIDQASQQITSIFPIGLAPASEPVADAPRRAVYTGGYNGTTTVVSTALNRIVDNLPAYPGFAPGLATVTKIYGAYNGESVTYNLAQKTTTALRYPLPDNPNYFAFASSGSGPPNGATYWAPFDVNPVAVGDGPNSSYLGGVAIYDTETSTLAGRLLSDFPAGPLAFSPDSGTAYVANRGLVSVVDAQTFQTITIFKYPMRIDGLVVSPDGLTLYADAVSAIFVLDAKTGVEKNVFALPNDEGVSLSISADGNTLFVTDPVNSAIDLIDTGTGKLSAVALPYSPTGLAVVGKP